MEDKPFPFESGVLPTIAETPMATAYLRIGGRLRQVHLKLEGCTPDRSLKDRAAAFLLADLELRSLLRPSSIVIESTSGNVGVSLARLCRDRGYGFLAVIDPKTTPENRRKMQSFGAEFDLVETVDDAGGYLLYRLERVRELCATSDRYVWTDQYSSAANPRAHYASTAPEIYRQMAGRVDAIFVAVSTGGTLAGIGRYFREISPASVIVGVDARGSVVFGGPPGPRKLTGIGSSRKSSFLDAELFDSHTLVFDPDAFAVCRRMSASIGIKVGGSSGAVLFACAQYLAHHPAANNVVCVCADHGENYVSTIFNDDWLRTNGFDTQHRVDLIEEIVVAAAPLAR